MKKRISLVLLVALLLLMFIVPSMAGTANVIGDFGDSAYFQTGVFLDARHAGIDNSPDPSQPGYYWLKFNALKPFSSVYIVLYAEGAVETTGKWELFAFDTNNDTTLAGTPVKSDVISQQGDQHLILDLGNQPAGQYIFKVSQDDGPVGHWFCLATTSSSDALDENKFEYELNGFQAGSNPYLYAQFTFDGDGEFFGALEADGSVTPPETPVTGEDDNPPTGDISMISLLGLALATSLAKRRKVK